MEYHHTDRAPAAIGPYSQAVSAQGFLYTSGQLGMTTNGDMPKSFEGQAELVMQNLQAILESAGCTFQDVLKATIYVTDLDHFGTLNEIYGRYMGKHRPARATVQVAALPKDGLVEIDLVAVRRAE